VKKVKILSGQKLNVRTLAESEDWLDNLEFDIKNKWDKQITFIKIDLEFPDTWAAGRPLMIDNLYIWIHFGEKETGLNTTQTRQADMSGYINSLCILLHESRQAFL
jgi:hypothetical protein